MGRSCEPSITAKCRALSTLCRYIMYVMYRYIHGVVPQQVGVERSTSATLRLKLIYRLIPADRSTNKLIRRLIDQTTNTMTNIFAPRRDSNTLYSRQCQYMRRAPPALHPRLFHLYHSILIFQIRPILGSSSIILLTLEFLI